VYKFYGVDAPEGTQQEAAAKTTKTVNFADTQGNAAKEESYEDALKVFYGVEQPTN
jgi:hypothetical protein